MKGDNKMRITEVTEDYIEFDNGNKIEFNHRPHCCEYNYADFLQIEELARDVEFNEDLVFEEAEYSGFRFGCRSTGMFFIPCYSTQNGYYTTEVTILYKDEAVLQTHGEYN